MDCNMREIKFRAWDIEERKMIYERTMTHVDEDSDEHDCKIILAPYDDESFIGFTTSCVFEEDITAEGEKVKGTLMQYTGIKDKNGKEIYEGDVVRLVSQAGGYYSKFEVKYGEFVEQDDEDNDIKYVGFNLFKHIDYGEWEVIGNKFENPELLDEKPRKS